MQAYGQVQCFGCNILVGALIYNRVWRYIILFRIRNPQNSIGKYYGPFRFRFTGFSSWEGLLHRVWGAQKVCKKTPVTGVHNKGFCNASQGSALNCRDVLAGLDRKVNIACLIIS